jgi:hypothetical protein
MFSFVSRTVLVTAFASLAIALAPGCNSDVDQDVGFATEGEACRLAAFDASGYCRAPSGRFASNSCCVAPEAIGDIEGFIDEIYIGEMDPFVVGDVCVFWVKDYDSDRVVGVIEDFCEEALLLSDVDAVGWSILFEESGLEEVSAEEDEVLQDYRTAAKYYRFWGDVIIPENTE